jgi:hypothetical protein
MLIGLDVGNYALKLVREGRSFSLLSDVIELDADELKQATGGQTSFPPQYALVDGRFMCFGETAQRYRSAPRPTGAARYSRDYYGALALYALARFILFEKPRAAGVVSVTLNVTYPPLDALYASELPLLLLGLHKVTLSSGTVDFEIARVITTPEPVAGALNLAFSARGEQVKNNPLRQSTLLVVDVGGYSSDLALVFEGSATVFPNNPGARIGTLETLREMEQRMRRRYRDEFRSIGDIDISRLDRALREGKFPYGSRFLDMEEDALHLRQTLANKVASLIQGVGGAGNFDRVIMPGGGSPIIIQLLREAFEGLPFSLAVSRNETINARFAVASGAFKVLAAAKRGGRLK